MWKNKEDINGWIFFQLQELQVQCELGWPRWWWNPRRGHVWAQGSGAVSEWGWGSSTVSTDEANLVDRPPAQTNLNTNLNQIIQGFVTLPLWSIVMVENIAGDLVRQGIWIIQDWSPENYFECKYFFNVQSTPAVGLRLLVKSEKTSFRLFMRKKKDDDKNYFSSWKTAE